MGEKLDVLGLSLSLSIGGSPYAGDLKATQLSVPTNNNNNKSTTWNGLFRLSADRISISDDDNDHGDNSTVSRTSSSGKRSEREEDNGAVTPTEFYDEDSGGSGDPPTKKLRLTKEQSMLLEETFKQHNTLNPKQKQALAKELNLRARQVEVWFQNRRARTKLKQTEVDCEYLKRCCENLSEENRRLHKEVQELRALKLSPQLFMHMNPPTTVTMCPSCERVAASSSSGTDHSAQPPNNCSNLLGPNIRRPVPVNPWPFKGSISRP